MTHETETTRVIFRRWRLKLTQEVIAIFPDNWYWINNGQRETQMYEHIGQHGRGDAHHVIRKTTPATPDQYADLKEELEGLGYVLKIIKRYPPANRRDKPLV